MPYSSSGGRCVSAVAVGPGRDEEFGGLRSPFFKYSRAIAASRQSWNDMPGQRQDGAALQGELPPAGGGPNLVPQAAQPSVRGEALGYLNLFLLHAGHSPLTTIEVQGVGRRTTGAHLVLSVSPPLFDAVTVPCTGEAPPTPPRVNPDGASFFRLEESSRATLRIALRYGASTVTAWEDEVTAQAANEWINVPACAASLACAITPNSPAVTGLLASLNEDLLAYQRPHLADMEDEVRAIYDLVAELGLRYLPEPPSFDRTGQKVLFPADVLAGLRGCCVDISVLTCALLERAGYNAVVMLVDGHAFPGVWTSDQRSRHPLLQDAARIRQAVEAGDLLLWNSTNYFLESSRRDFESARIAAEARLDAVHYAIDVAACRAADFPRYKPISRVHP